MRNRLEWEWERLDEDTERAKVFGGWIVKHTIEYGDSDICATSMVFVPNTNHDWTITKPIPPEAIPEPVSKGF